MTTAEAPTALAADVDSRRRLPTLVLFLAVALVVGLGYGYLEETQEFGMAAWWIFVFGAIGLTATGVAFSNRQSGSIRPAFKAVPVMVVALCGLTLGHFVAYAVGIDGRTLDEYSLSMSWQANLLATLFMAVLFGSLLGLLTALLSHSLRRSLPGAA
jgi:hypothetical protein